MSSIQARDLLDKQLHAAWIRSSAESSPLALLLVGFDQPATAVGIGILERALRVHCARTHDVFIRRAHDEYVAILPDTPPAGARHVGGQIVEAMRAEDSDHAHRVSVGVAVAVPDEHRDPHDLLRRAESALQGARVSGGDRVAGGAAAGTPAVNRPSGALAQLRDVLSGKKKQTDLRRRTD